MRGLYGGFGMVCNFIALVHLKLSDATILFQTSGIFVLIFSALFLKERVPKGAGKMASFNLCSRNGNGKSI